MTDDPSTNSGEWVCGTCGDDPLAHATPGSTCVWEPTLVTTSPAPDDHDGYTINLGAPSVVVQDSERPDTEELRSLASFMESDDDARLIRAAADWIESAGWMWIKPAAGQGPDLSEAAALLDEYDQSVHNLTRFGTVEAQTDHLLASERVAAFARRLLDREGGT